MVPKLIRDMPGEQREDRCLWCAKDFWKCQMQLRLALLT
jgi:hypothetical protein